MMEMWRGTFVADRVRKFNSPLIILGKLIGVPALIDSSHARATPFGFHEGWWLGCWLDCEQQTNRCRLYGPGLHPSVVYEERYGSCEGKALIPVDEVKLQAPSDASNMWISQESSFSFGMGASSTD